MQLMMKKVLVFFPIQEQKKLQNFTIFSRGRFNTLKDTLFFIKDRNICRRSLFTTRSGLLFIPFYRWIQQKLRQRLLPCCCSYFESRISTFDTNSLSFGTYLVLKYKIDAQFAASQSQTVLQVLRRRH